MAHDSDKRSFLRLAAAGTLALAGCSKSEPAAEAAARATAPAAASAGAAPKAAPLKAAWIYVAPIGNAGWSFAHDQGRQAAQAHFGDKLATTYVESVPEGADTERVLRDLIGQGNTHIFGTSFGFMEAMVKVARDFPHVRFEHCTGYKTAANLNVYDSRFYQATYLAGIVAGHLTQTRTLGYVGSVPIPEVLRNINAFTLGARSVQPDVTTRVVWTNSWYDPPGETTAAQALMTSGADILLQNTDSPAVIQAVAKAGKLGFGWDSDMSRFGNGAHLGSCIADWAHYYRTTLQKAMDGIWEGGQTTRWGVPEGQNNLVKISDAVPADVRAAVSDIKARMTAHTFDVFKGPIVDRSGKEQLAAGVPADDAWMGAINFFIPGVEGTLPGSQG